MDSESRALVTPVYDSDALSEWASTIARARSAVPDSDRRAQEILNELTYRIRLRQTHLFTRVRQLPSDVLWLIWGEFLAHREYLERLTVLCRAGHAIKMFMRREFAKLGRYVLPRPIHRLGGDVSATVKLRAASLRVWRRENHESVYWKAAGTVQALLHKLSREKLDKQLQLLREAERVKAQAQAERLQLVTRRATGEEPRFKKPKLLLTLT